jgi:hypothetical protein
VAQPNGSANTPADIVRLGRVATFLLGAGLVVVGLLLVGSLIGLWPLVERTHQPRAAPEYLHVVGTSLRITFTPDTALLVLVVVASALGGFVHTATSFSTYVGNQRLSQSWLWWYVLRTFIGIALAVSFYFALRAGLLSAQVSGDSINPYGVAAIAALVGLFSKQATDKLRELFETMFRTAEGYGDDERTGKAANPMPTIVGVEPRRVPAGSDAVMLSVQGQGFVPHSVTQVGPVGRPVDAIPRTMRYVGPNEIKVALAADDVAQVGAVEIVVVNPEPGGGRSNPMVLDVHDVGA